MISGCAIPVLDLVPWGPVPRYKRRRFRGPRFASRDLKGDNVVLVLTRPT
jgi:hypothetical protein